MKKFAFTEASYANYEETITAIRAELAEMLTGEKITRKYFAAEEPCTIIEVVKNAEGIYLQTVNELNKTALLDPVILFKNKLITFENTEKQLEAEQYVENYADFVSAYKAKIFAEESAAIRAKYEAKKAAKEKEALERKIEDMKASVIASAERLSAREHEDRIANEFYVSLGYIAKHAKKFTAKMPDYLNNWFITQFGTEAERSLVDSTKRTVNGFPMQWALSMTISLDTNDNMPAYLMQYLSSQKKEIKDIANTEFVYDLVSDYGFKFGKEQNLDSVLENIPEDEVESFNIGYNL